MTLLPIRETTDYRGLFHAGDWDLVTHVIRRDPTFTLLAAHRQCDEQQLADRILTGAIEYLRYAASTSPAGSPSVRVDIGWHALLLVPRVNRYVSEQLFGAPLDHEPTPPGRPAAGLADCNFDPVPGTCRPRCKAGGEPVQVDTAADMARLGFAVDDLLWSGVGP